MGRNHPNLELKRRLRLHLQEVGSFFQEEDSYFQEEGSHLQEQGSQIAKLDSESAVVKLSTTENGIWKNGREYVLDHTFFFIGNVMQWTPSEQMAEI